MGSATPARPRILVVEDEHLVRQLIVIELEEAGYDVVEAADGNQALDALSRAPVPDGLFTDIRLPGRLDGWAIAEAARKASQKVIVVYATGYTADEPKLVPGSTLLAKPYRPAAVIEEFRRLGLPT
jgi:CheY-like chemotaxis protein